MDVVVEVAKDLSKEVGAGLYNLGEYSLQKVSDYWWAPASASSEGSAGGGGGKAGMGSGATGAGMAAGSPGGGGVLLKKTAAVDPEVAGTIVVYDLVLERPIAVYRPFSAPVRHLSFDQSGTLLFSCDVSGYVILFAFCLFLSI